MFEYELANVHLKNIKKTIKDKHNKKLFFLSKKQIKDIDDERINEYLLDINIPDLLVMLCSSIENHKSSKKLDGDLKSNRVKRFLKIICDDLSKEIYLDSNKQQEIINVIIDLTKHKYKINQKSLIKSLSNIVICIFKKVLKF